jgi:adhesin HecA-like repeat protein
MAPADPTRIDVETELREAIWTGRLVKLRSRDATANDPAESAGWPAQRIVPAALLAELLTSTEGSRRPRALRLAGARITGQLDLEAIELVCPLLLQGCWFAEPPILAEAQAPTVRLPGCHLPGLSADQLATRGNLELNKGFTAAGEVSLFGAHIGGDLALNGATLTNPDGRALHADGLTVDQNMVCREGFSAIGEVRLPGAHIGGQLSLSGATLANPDGYALSADGLTVDQDMVCREGFSAIGEVRLPGAHIGGALDLSGATLTNPDGDALSADRLTVDHHMLCRQGFSATGQVHLLGAHIGGQLDLSGATLTNPDGRTLNLQELRAGGLLLRALTKPPERADFMHARVDALVDEAASWPRQADLDGFVYDALYERRPVSARQRLDWLARNPRGYIPQPYEQLAAVYRRAGRDQDARTVAIAKQRRRRRTLHLLGKAWNLLLYATVGYGYRMWLAIVWLLLLVAVGWWRFDRAHPAHLVAAKPPGQRPWFHAGIYALDLLLPFADLGYQGAWIATGTARWLYLGWNLAGWVLTTAVVAALTGLLKRD